MSEYSSAHASAYEFGVEGSFPGRVDRGGVGAVELGGILQGRYPTGPPSETAAHAPHPPDGARSHLSSAPAVCRFLPVPGCCMTPVPGWRSAKAAAAMASAAAVPAPTASPSTAAVAAVVEAAAAAATTLIALMLALALALVAVSMTAAVEAAAFTLMLAMALASAAMTVAQARTAVTMTLVAAAVLTRPPSIPGVPVPPASAMAPGVLLATPQAAAQRTPPFVVPK